MRNNSPQVCVVGSTNIDLTFRMARFPDPGETLTGHAFHLGFGGKGANQAVMAARLGTRVTLISRIGQDVFTDPLLRNYREQGIDTTHVRIEEALPSGVAAVLVDAAARNCILVVPGANYALSPRDVHAAASTIAAADVLLVQLEVPVETTWEALRIARKAGVRTIFNPAPACDLPNDLLEQVDLCVPNEVELSQLTGRVVTTPEDAEAAAHRLLKRGPRAVIVTLGPRGALILDDNGSELIPTPTVRAVDSSGAGDAFIGALAFLLGTGRSLRHAVQGANGVAALSVTREGTQSAFPTRTEVEAFQASWSGE